MKPLSQNPFALFAILSSVGAALAISFLYFRFAQQMRRDSLDSVVLCSLWMSCPYFLMGSLAFAWHRHLGVSAVQLAMFLLIGAASVYLTYDHLESILGHQMAGRRCRNCGPPYELVLPILQRIAIVGSQVVTGIHWAFTPSPPADVSF